MIISHSFQLFYQSNKLNINLNKLNKSFYQFIRQFTSHQTQNKTNKNFSHLFDKEISLLHQINSNSFSIHLSNQWSITTIPNGGFLSSLAVKASRQIIQHGNIISLSSHFYNRTIENCDTEIIVEILNSTKSSSTVLTTILQENIKRCSFFLTFSFKKSNKFTFIDDDERCE